MEQDALRRTVILIAVGLLIGACTDPRERGDEMVLYYYLRGEANSLDPARGNLEHEKSIQSQLYEPLYEYHYLKRPYELQPLLAESMPIVSDDGLIYTVRIKSGVRYHDDPCFPDGKGREVVAQDFVYAWKRIADPRTNSDGSWIFDGKVAGFEEWRDAASAEPETSYSRPLEGFRALDRTTIQIRLLQPYPQLRFVLAMVYTPPLPQECVEHYGDEFGNHAIGTGPFRLEKWVRGSRLVMVRNPTWRGQTYPAEGSAEDREMGLLHDAGKPIPFLDRVVYKEMVESQPRWLSFMAGELDTIKMDKDNYASYFDEDGAVRPAYSERGFRGLHLPLLDFYYEGFNMEDPVVGGEQGKALRRAICLVRNFDKKNRIYYSNRNIMAVSPIPPNLPEYEPVPENPYRRRYGDVEGALRILHDAGVDPKQVPELVYTTYTGGDSRQLAENYAGEVAKLGLRMRLEVATWPEFIGKLNRKQIQMFGLVWGADYPDAENFLQLFTCASVSPGPNNSNYCNPEYDRLYAEGLVLEPGSPERTAIYRRMAQMIIEDCPVCPEMHRERHYAYHERLKNFRPDETMENYLKYWRIEMPKAGG
jgi:oligopeptide transport system substrate-binding protein